MKSKQNDFLIPFVTFLIDIIFLELAIIVSYWTRFYSDLTKIIPVTEGIPELKKYILSSVIFIPIWIYILVKREMYQTRRNTHISDEFFPLLKSLTVGLVFILGVTFFYRDFSFSRVVFILILFYSTLFVLIGRFISINIEKILYKNGFELKSVIVVGTTETTDKILKIISEKKSLGLKLCGYFSDNPIKNEFEKYFIGNLNEVDNFLANNSIDTILISLQFQDHPKLIELVKNIEGRNIEILFVPDLIDLMTSRVRTQEIEGIPFVKIKDTPITFWNKFLKRTFDISVSLFLLIVLAPLHALIFLLVKSTSKGPIYFNQTRISLDGNKFTIYKYRSMFEDAEFHSGPIRAKVNDMRVTKIGKILRRTSLDELPQLFNVLKGEMSLVGPRPERPHFIEEFKNQIPRYLERHRVKTGMTGWAQVNGFRGDAPISERTKYDIYYVENWSIAFDIKIIFKTIYSVIFAKDAY